MARKENKFAEEIDLTTFNWVNAGSNAKMGKPGCGGCHPGGGGLEHDRDGNRYDVHLRENPRLASTLDGDYFQSQWDKSGVVEADCLICHQPGYFFKERLSQLLNLNYQWAVVAGSGVAQVYGSVKDGGEPTLVYNKRFFNDDGKITFTLAAEPQSDNCLFCHGKADMIKRGFSWDDKVNHDVHSAENIACTACHPAGIEHQLGKGNENLSTVRDDLDNTMRTCIGCHQEGYMGAPRPQHKDIRQNHLEKLSCEVCHIPELGRSSALGLDVSAGKVRLYPRKGAESVGSVLKWMPEMHLGQDKKLHPVNEFQPNLYTNRSRDGLYVPLFAKEIKKAYELVSSSLQQESPYEPLVNSEKEIKIMLEALAVTLADNPRFSVQDPRYHQKGQMYFLDSEGSLQMEPDSSWAAERNPFNVNHNVAPTQLALGSGGCADCHADRAVIFSTWLAGYKADEMLEDNDSNLLGKVLSDESRVFYLDQLHKYNSTKKFLIPLLVVTVFTLILFRDTRGKGAALQPLHVVESAREWAPALALVLLVRNVSFFFLIFTGLGFFFNKNNILGLFFESTGSAVVLHWSAGVVFLGSILSCILIRRVILAKKGADICHLSVLGGKTLVPLMALSGICMIFREVLGHDLMYLSSIVHTLAAFILIAVFAAKNYARLTVMLEAREKNKAGQGDFEAITPRSGKK